MSGLSRMPCVGYVLDMAAAGDTRRPANGPDLYRVTARKTGSAIFWCVPLGDTDDKRATLFIAWFADIGLNTLVEIVEPGDPRVAAWEGRAT